MKNYSLLIITVLACTHLYSMDIPFGVASNTKGQTAVHLEVKRLLEEGGELAHLKALLKDDNRLANIKDSEEKTPVDYTCEYENTEIVRELLKEYDGELDFYEEKKEEQPSKRRRTDDDLTGLLGSMNQENLLALKDLVEQYMELEINNFVFLF